MMPAIRVTLVGICPIRRGIDFNGYPISIPAPLRHEKTKWILSSAEQPPLAM
jgi:hypothetical protein